MATNKFGSFGPLIGVVHVGNTHCRFFVYSTKNAEVLTYHEMKLRQIVHNAGWLEFDPAEIWKYTQECIETACRSLVILEINPCDIIAVGICNQRGTTVLWDKETGNALHNAIGWTDCRTTSSLEHILKNVKYNTDALRADSGLPLSTCFSALKIKWLLENVKLVKQAVAYGSCLFGTLDTWIMWNLTGSVNSGVHSTDITNAGYTQLMNIHKLQWDAGLCKFFHIPKRILPRICTNSELFGYVIGGPLNGVPIASCIGDQQAALLGQLSTKVGYNSCCIDDSCFVMFNTGNELIESENGLLSSVAYKLGVNEDPVYALEGAISNSGSTVTWLKESLRINTEIKSNDNEVETFSTFLGETSMISSSCSSSLLNAECGLAAKRSEVTFVPAFHGLYAPYWRYDARGILLGLTTQTTAENVTQAAYEATGFQIHDILQAFKRDTPNWDHSQIDDRLIISGEFAENADFVQFIADIVGNRLRRPQTTSACGLGAMIAAGIKMKVVTLKHAQLMYTPPADVFMPTTTVNRRELLYKRWEYSLKKCLNWRNYEAYEADFKLFSQREVDPFKNIRRSLPGSLFMMSTFILLLVSRFLQNNSLR